MTPKAVLVRLMEIRPQPLNARPQQQVDLRASTDQDFDTVFARLVELRAGGLVIGGEPFFNSRSEQLGGPGEAAQDLDCRDLSSNPDGASSRISPRQARICELTLASFSERSLAGWPECALKNRARHRPPARPH